MEKRLANIITTPGMVVTVAMAIGLLVTNPGWLHQGWMHVKLAFVALLLAYHLFCYRLMGQLEQGVCTWSSGKLRALNEAPTLLLVVIVMLAVFKAQFPTGSATWLAVALVVFYGTGHSTLCPQASTGRGAADPLPGRPDQRLSRAQAPSLRTAFGCWLAAPRALGSA